MSTEPIKHQYNTIKKKIKLRKKKKMKLRRKESKTKKIKIKMYRYEIAFVVWNSQRRNNTWRIIEIKCAIKSKKIFIIIETP